MWEKGKNRRELLSLKKIATSVMAVALGLVTSMSTGVNAAPLVDQHASTAIQPEVHYSQTNYSFTTAGLASGLIDVRVGGYNVEFSGSQKTTSGTASINYYLYDTATKTVVRGPVSVTGNGSYGWKTFYNVPVGKYYIKATNQASGTISGDGVATHAYWL